uniref:Uncharacterized protein n=1 Tax=Wrangelia sp. TaxID=2575620 RepID=A0A4D6X0A1_9FLOR|nr:hypothetical protein [Wrangelia sp.]
MCICINCIQINRCKVYLFIQQQNKNQIINNIHSSFIPHNTLININMKTLKSQNTSLSLIDWDLVECSSFVEKPGLWLIQNI